MLSLDEVLRRQLGGALPTYMRPGTGVAPIASTPLPPTQVQTVRTGGVNPPVTVNRTAVTGGQTPPTMMRTSAPPTGGNTPPTTVQTMAPTAVPMMQAPVLPAMPAVPNINVTPVTVPGGAWSPAQTIEQMTSQLANGQIARNAELRGIEMAGARGLVNSSVAGGAARRAALESITPLVGQGIDLLNQREGRALTTNQNALDRAFQGRENALERNLRRTLQNDQAAQQNWLNHNQYAREFNGNLSLIPIANSTEFMQYLFQMGAQDPEVYTPNVLSGMQNFFTQSMNAMLKQFFPGSK